MKTASGNLKSVNNHYEDGKSLNMGFRTNEEFLMPEEGSECIKSNKENDSKTDIFNSLMQVGKQSAHQLNNRLTTILANTQLMTLMVDDEVVKSYLKIVEDTTREASLIIRTFQESAQVIARLYSQGNLSNTRQSKRNQ